jgi:hypothetical protein
MSIKKFPADYAEKLRIVNCDDQKLAENKWNKI